MHREKVLMTPAEYAAKVESDLDRLVTVKRAEIIAQRLYPDEYVVADYDCGQSEDGSNPCRFCQEKHDLWRQRVAQVRVAVMEGFR